MIYFVCIKNKNNNRNNRFYLNVGEKGERGEDGRNGAPGIQVSYFSFAMSSCRVWNLKK